MMVIDGFGGFWIAVATLILSITVLAIISEVIKYKMFKDSVKYLSDDAMGQILNKYLEETKDENN